MTILHFPLSRVTRSLITALFCISLCATAAPAQTTGFTYQGRLTDGGTPANGDYELQFVLWDNASGGSQIGLTQTLNAVSVSAGIFTVTLDFGANAFPGGDRFLEISARQSGCRRRCQGRAAARHSERQRRSRRREVRPYHRRTGQCRQGTAATDSATAGRDCEFEAARLSAQPPCAQTVSINYYTLDQTATSGSDYQEAIGVLTFNPGETFKTITVLVNGDTQVETNETFSVIFYNAINANGGGLAAGTILNDDGVAQPTLQFSQANYSVQEDLTAVAITVTRTGDTSGSASVSYATSDGTAQQKSDYEIATGTLDFAAGEASKSFQVLINEDMYAEGNETFTVSLSNAIGASPGSTGTATVTIVDDSPESFTNPIDAAQSFVYMQYHDFLNREPDAGGLAYWTGQITQCGNDAQCLSSRRIGVSAAYFIELEFQDTGYYVYRLQKASFGAQPVYLQFMTDRSSIVAGGNLQANKSAFAAQWVNRAAFLQAYPASMSQGDFVNKLFDTAGLMPYTTERTQEMQALVGNTKTRAQVLQDVIEMPEFKQREYNPAFVSMQYFGYLRRDPDQGGYQFWLNILNTKLPNDPSGYRAMVCAFITSAEYQDRFGSLHSHSNSECGP